MPANKVFIARHGQRIDHVDKAWRLSSPRPHDPFLTATGTQQAQALGRHLREENITQIYASPFLRTLQTAHHANLAMDSPAEIRVERGMCEYLNPSWFPMEPEFLPFDAAELESMTIARDYTPVGIVRYPETRQELIERVGDCVRKLVDLDMVDGNVLLVGHGITCEFAARGLCNVGRREHINYCGLQTCERGAGGWSVGGVHTGYMPEEIRPTRKGTYR